MVWEASRPYLYLRTTADGRLVAGGMDEAGAARHAARRLLERKARGLQRRVEALVQPVSLQVDYSWGGSFGESRTSLPVIDQLPGMPGCHVVMGFGGNGFVNSVIASQVIAEAIEGRHHPDARLYRLEAN